MTNLTQAQQTLLDTITQHSTYDWVEIYPVERRTAQALMNKGLLELTVKDGVITEARLAREDNADLLAKDQQSWDIAQMAARLSGEYPVSPETLERQWLSC